MKIINFINNILAKLETIFLIIVLLSMILVAFLQVILRNFFSTSILWGDTFSRHLVLWVGFLGASLATYEGRHITIDIFSRLLSPTFKRVVAILVNIFSATVCFFLMKAAINFISIEKREFDRLKNLGVTNLIAGIPEWIYSLIIAIAFGIMTLRFLIHALENIVNRKSQAQKERS